MCMFIVVQRPCLPIYDILLHDWITMDLPRALVGCSLVEPNVFESMQIIQEYSLVAWSSVGLVFHFRCHLCL